MNRNSLLMSLFALFFLGAQGCSPKQNLPAEESVPSEPSSSEIHDPLPGNPGFDGDFGRYMKSQGLKYVPFYKSKLEAPIHSRQDPFSKGKPSCTCTNHCASELGDVKKLEFLHRGPKDKGGKAWGAIGYHFWISKEGEVYSTCPLYYIGAHTYGKNQTTIGIGVDGCHTEKESDQYPHTPHVLTEKMEKAYIALCAFLQVKYGWKGEVKDLHLMRSRATDDSYKNSPGEHFIKAFDEKLAEGIKKAVQSLRAEMRSKAQV